MITLVYIVWRKKNIIEITMKEQFKCCMSTIFWFIVFIYHGKNPNSRHAISYA